MHITQRMYVAVERCARCGRQSVRVSILNNDRKTTVKYNVCVFVSLLLSLFVAVVRCWALSCLVLSRCERVFVPCLRYLFMVAKQKHVKLPAMNKIRK